MQKMKKIRDSHKRSLVKSISWRVLATMATMSLVYIFTGRFELAISVGLIEVFLKLLLYYFHERAWLNISWGKKAASAIEDEEE